MPKIPGTFVGLTDTTASVNIGEDWFGYPGYHPAHQALMDWLRDHDIRPEEIPADAVISRDVDARTITYPSVLMDETGAAILRDREIQIFEITKQLDRPPAPWPAELVDYAKEAKS